MHNKTNLILEVIPECFLISEFFVNEKKENSLTHEIKTRPKTGSGFFCICKIISSR
nr:MAG TPA: hypothetical protein [Caudoviricetes sp.]